MSPKSVGRLVPLLAGGLVLFSACLPEGAPPEVPSVEEVSAYYEYSGEMEITVSGNVPQVTVTVDRNSYAQGGELWAKAFPYLFLFTPGTLNLLDEYPGVGGVRVVTRYDDGSLVAEALLEREKIDRGDWSRALAAALAARQEGTQSPQRMDDLVRIGEEYTEFEYNLENVRRRAP